ncbi:MAG TPA: winged helix-turn-helix domain-containing protein [Candidatus Acidoferrales bacterium]
MTTAPHPTPTYRFGLFEVFPESGQIFHQGHRTKIQEQPFRLLVALLEHPGEIVTRESLRQLLWSGGTFVEFDQSLGTAVTKLRQALGDDADNPRFIETVPKRGYRFIAPVYADLEEPSPSVQTSELKIESLLSVADGSSQSLPAKNVEKPAGVSAAPRFRFLVGAAALLLLATGAWLYVRHQRRVFHFTPQDSIVVADFANSTGEPVFDDALKQGLDVGLEQSPMIHITSDEKSSAVLTQMGRPADSPVTGTTAIEICQRTGGKATVQGSISRLGTAYVIGLTAIRCDNGEPVAHEQAEALRKEDVIEALGKTTSLLRTRLGESLPSIQKYDAPLEQATTKSLEALKAYSLAFSAQNKRGDEASIPLFQKAIQLDPDFAMAYGELAAVYENRGESELARENAAKAYELRGRTTEFERLSIESWYYSAVTGDMEKAAEVLEMTRQTYPSDPRALNDLGAIYGNMGVFGKAADIYRETIKLDSSSATSYGNLAVTLMAIGRVDEANATLADAAKKSLQTDYLLQVNYWSAFLRGDSVEMKHLVSIAPGVPDAHSLLLAEQSDTEAYSGHFEKADRLSRAAAASMESAGEKEAAGLCLAQAAVREAEVGNSAKANELIAQALSRSRDQSVTILSALVMARTGEIEKARAIAGQLDHQNPASTFVQKYWIPTIRAGASVQAHQGPEAVAALALYEPFDFATPGEFAKGTLYPAYVRGQSYLAAGDGAKAAQEFQKLLDHPGIVLNYPLGALARLGRARAEAMNHDVAKSREDYESFLVLWKDADADLPILVQARQEFHALR